MMLRMPREPRRLMIASARMREGERESAAVIGNVSKLGLMVKCDRPPAPGARVEIWQGGLRIEGEVRWTKHRRFGLRSDEPIDLSALFPAPEPSSEPRAPKRFTPREFRPRPRPRKPERLPELPVRKRTAPGGALVAVLAAAVTTVAVEMFLASFPFALDTIRQFIPG